MSDALETIREKLIKLQRLIQDPAATEGERSSAQLRYTQILKRHGLTEDDVANTTRSPFVFQWAERRWGRQLLIQCAAWLLDEEPVKCESIGNGCVSIRMTPLDAADLRACYDYYVGIMEGQLSVLRVEESQSTGEIRARLQTLQQELDKRKKVFSDERKGMLDALILRYKLRPTPKGQPSKRRLSSRDLQEFIDRLRRSRRFHQDAWERTIKLGDQGGLLLGDGGD